MYYGNQSKVEFQTNSDIDWLKKELSKENNILIVRNKDLKDIPFVKTVQKGNKYSIIERLKDEK